MTNFKIEILSDVVCPWCYIGKKRLEKAISVHKKTYPGSANDTFTYTWLPYYLDPTAPNPGVPMLSRFVTLFGPQKAEFMQQRMAQVGAEEGINFTFSGKIGKTRDAHRLIELAKRQDDVMVQTKLHERLFEAYFEQGGDITDQGMLRDAGVAAGLDADVTKDWLESGKGGEEVDRQVDSARQGPGGVSGVPRYLIQGKYVVEGAQDPSTFMKIFGQIKQGEPAS